MKIHPASVEMGLNIYEPKVNINAVPLAMGAYMRYKKALGLWDFEPPSDQQRKAFDCAFLDPQVDFDKFLQNCKKVH